MSNPESTADDGRAGQLDAVMIPNIAKQNTVEADTGCSEQPGVEPLRPDTKTMDGNSPEARPGPVPLVRDPVFMDLGA